MAAALHISINAEKVFDIAGVPISNSILTTWIVTAIIFFLCYKSHQIFSKVSSSHKPSRVQSFLEMIIESLYGLVHSIAGDKQKARAFFPLVSTFFLFILISNWTGLLPGVGSIGFTEYHEAETEHATTQSDPGSFVPVAFAANPTQEDAIHEEDLTKITDPAAEATESEHAETEKKGSFVPYFRGPTADLNTTLALAVFSMVSVQVIGFKFLGGSYSHKFFNFTGPIDFFVGFLELFSEISKIISFAFRLFGNIFAGEVLLTVIAFLMPLFAPLPFLGLEIFVGFIQALVFSMLTLVFMNLATMSHGGEHAQSH